MTVSEAIKILEQFIINPRQGLPEEVFLFISQLTPLLNVDLLIKDEKGRTLLSWRDDEYAGTGWHLPGGIVRFKEKLVDRVLKVAETEIGIPVEFKPEPIAINEIFCSQDIRGHFISFLYECYIPSSFVPKNEGLEETDRGYLMWHSKCPENLIKIHEIYRKYIDGDSCASK